MHTDNSLIIITKILIAFVILPGTGEGLTSSILIRLRSGVDDSLIFHLHQQQTPEWCRCVEGLWGWRNHRTH